MYKTESLCADKMGGSLCTFGLRRLKSRVSRLLNSVSQKVTTLEDSICRKLKRNSKMAPDIDRIWDTNQVWDPTTGPVVDAAEERKNIIKRASNQKVLVPDLLSLMPGWPCDYHPDMEEVNEQIDEWLKSVNLPEDKKAKHRARGNYTLLTAVYYPNCKKEKMLALDQFLYWVFFFDDDIDTGGELMDDTEGTLRCCAAAHKCIDDCLGPNPCFVSPEDVRDTVKMLYPILEDLRSGMAPSGIERLRVELHEYINGVERQQGIRQGARLPDPWYHLQIRADDVGVIPNIVQAEYAMEFALPESVWKHESIQTMAHESTILTILVNEIYSSQKEFRDSQLENFVFLLMNKYNLTIQGALDKVLDLIRQHYEIFVEAEKRLPWSKDDKKLNAAIEQTVITCKRLATGTVYWSYFCERYFKPSQMNANRDVVLDYSRP
ncbi:terpene synthase [Biscogniauxia sp. FL1348]|nr:terpene synthase [Biscogniauxia sp. FL1348]